MRSRRQEVRGGSTETIGARGVGVRDEIRLSGSICREETNAIVLGLGYMLGPMLFSLSRARLWKRPTPLRCAPLLLLALVTGPAGFLFGENIPTDWRISSAESRLTVHVLPAGLLASALHPHHFQPEVWSGELSWDPSHPDSVRVDVRIAAASLRDHQPKLSAQDISKVEGQTRGPEILDAAKFPQILFEARQLEAAQIPSGGSGDLRATLVGTLTLHGKPRPLKFAIQGRAGADRLEAAATVTFKQSDFGIKPYKTALGTIAVGDEVTVEISLVAVPRKPE